MASVFKGFPFFKVGRLYVVWFSKWKWGRGRKDEIATDRGMRSVIFVHLGRVTMVYEIPTHDYKKSFAIVGHNSVKTARLSDYDAQQRPASQPVSESS